MALDQTALKARLAAAHRMGTRGPENAALSIDSIGHLAHRNSMSFGPKPLIVHYQNDETRPVAVYSHESFADFAHRIANYLGTLGIDQGHTMATYTLNPAETLALFAAAWIIGVRVVPLNPQKLSPEQTRFCLKESASATIFVHNDLFAEWEAIHRDAQPGELDMLENVVRLGPSSSGTISFRERVVRQSPRINVDEPPDLSESALLIYKKTDEGQLVGVDLTLQQLLVNAEAIIQHLGIGPHDVVLSVQPIFQMETVILALLVPMLTGSSVVIDQPFSPSLFWQRLAKEQVTTVNLRPKHMNALLETEYGDGKGLDALDSVESINVLCSGYGMTGELLQRFRDVTGLQPLPGYCRPECAGYSTLSFKDDAAGDFSRLMSEYPNAVCIGAPLHCNELAILDDSGKVLPPGPSHPGRIAIRGWNLMNSYYKRDEINFQAFDTGWLDTGHRGFSVAFRGASYYFLLDG